MSLTAEQKQLRRTGIGSSDIAAIVGLSPFATAYDVYLSKVEGIDLEETFAMELGSLLEPAVLSLYERRAKPTMLRRSPGTFIHPKLPFVVDTPDAEAGHADGLRMVEAKTARFADAEEWGEEGTDAVPEHYVPQALWHIGMARARYCDSTITRCDLPVLIRTDEFRIYRIEWNEVLFGLLVEAAAKFWRDHVINGVPPSPEGSKRAAAFIKERFPRDNGSVTKATEEDLPLVNRAIAAHAAHEKAKAELEAAKFLLQKRMGLASILETPIGSVSWKRSRDTVGTDYEALAHELLATLTNEQRSVLVQKHQCVLKEGSRRMLLPKTK